MDRELSPEEIRDLLAAYAIDAVDDDERRAIDEYLAHDPDARAEVSGLQQSASYLAHTGGPPPPGVWERVESAIHESTRAEAPAPPRLVPDARRARTPRRWQWVAAAASVVAIVFGALLAVRWRNRLRQCGRHRCARNRRGARIRCPEGQARRRGRQGAGARGGAARRHRLRHEPVADASGRPYLPAVGCRQPQHDLARSDGTQPRCGRVPGRGTSGVDLRSPRSVRVACR